MGRPSAGGCLGRRWREGALAESPWVQQQANPARLGSLAGEPAIPRTSRAESYAPEQGPQWQQARTPPRALGPGRNRRHSVLAPHPVPQNTRSSHLKNFHTFRAPVMQICFKNEHCCFNNDQRHRLPSPAPVFWPLPLLPHDGGCEVGENGVKGSAPPSSRRTGAAPP